MSYRREIPRVGEAFLAEYGRVLDEWDKLLMLEKLKREEVKLLEGSAQSSRTGLRAGC